MARLVVVGRGSAGQEEQQGEKQEQKQGEKQEQKQEQEQKQRQEQQQQEQQQQQPQRHQQKWKQQQQPVSDRFLLPRGGLLVYMYIYRESERDKTTRKI